MKFTVTYNDKKTSLFDADRTTVEKDVERFTFVNEPEWEKVEYIDFRLHDFEIKAGDDGYFIVGAGNGDCISRDMGLCFFDKKQDGEYLIRSCFMPAFGVKHRDVCYAAIVTGMNHDVSQLIKICDGKYEVYVRVYTYGLVPYEKFSVDLCYLFGDDMNYSGMARKYRSYQLAKGFLPLKDRLNDALKYSVESVNVRIRMGWKPVPCVIEEQTVENEPPVHVACTFDDVVKVMESYHNAGIKQAEFCLVGWNMKGHDGRWPQILPPESSMGGYEGLERVIKKATELGYAITCHTNSNDSYTISEIYSDDDIARLPDGSRDTREARWGGGRTYCLCPEKALRLFDETLPAVEKLGFHGLHYIDVVTCLPPKLCFSKEHPVNAKESADYYSEIFSRAKKMFGAVGSEGPYDFCMKECDYALYISFSNFADKSSHFALCDRVVPFWQLVYHGIVPSNPYARTVNTFLSDDPDDLLKLVEFGGKPQIYYNARFVSDGTNWLGGETDFHCDNDEEREFATKLIKKTIDFYDRHKHLQYEYMENHEMLSDGVFETTYSDGTVVTVDYNKKTYDIKKA